MNDSNTIPDYRDREARIRLAVKCNYRCFFCHEEGGCTHGRVEWGPLKALLRELRAQGRREITFTGGEPLLNKPVLLKALAEIASWQVQPEVTLITNAALLDEAVIVALEHCRRAKVHVSIHNPRTADYQQITGQTRRTADELKPILKRLSSGPVRLKLNAVLTRDFAADDAFDALLAYAREVGATTVKFVELMRVGDVSRWPRAALSASEMNARLCAAGYADVRRTLRTNYWRAADGLALEVTHCACAMGCAHCEATRGDSFTGGILYHPCFLAEKTIPLAGRPLADVLAEGEAYLRGFIRTAA